MQFFGDRIFPGSGRVPPSSCPAGDSGAVVGGPGPRMGRGRIRRSPAPPHGPLGSLLSPLDKSRRPGEDPRGPSVSPPMPSAPHVLVTGAAGFIGAATVHHLLARGASVVGLDDLSAGDERRLDGVLGPGFRFVRGDVRDVPRLKSLLREAPSAVLHLAGRVGVRRVLADPTGCEAENVDSGRALGEALCAVRGELGTWSPRVISASTSEVYAESAEALSEWSALRGDNVVGRWRYAVSKRQAELELDQAAAHAHLPAPVHMRFFNVVGPGQDPRAGMVLPRFVEAARRGEPLRVHGSGSQVRTLAHVDSVAGDVTALCLGEVDGTFGGPLNVGGTARCTILELANRVVEATRRLHGVHADVIHVDPTKDVRANFEDVLHRVPDLGLLQSLGLGRSPWALDELVEDAVQRHGTTAALDRPSGRLAAALCESPAS